MDEEQTLKIFELLSPRPEAGGVIQGWTSPRAVCCLTTVSDTTGSSGRRKREEPSADRVLFAASRLNKAFAAVRQWSPLAAVASSG